MANKAIADPTPRVGRFSKVKDRPQVIYFIGTPCGEYVKIGYTRDLYPRFSTIQTGTPHDLAILFVIYGDRELEAKLHYQCGSDRVRGEWFRTTDRVRAVMDEARTVAIDYDVALSAMHAEQVSAFKQRMADRVLAMQDPGAAAELASYIRR
jgi:hypothetical protein